MNDSELLEMAAKAVGIELIRHDLEGLWIAGGGGIHWNPLTDDGDAFRLAMRLEMTLCTHSMGVYANSGDLMCSSPECTNNDRPALVRRTIVRLAAKIGSMKP
jgi:hypothetical protein